MATGDGNQRRDRTPGADDDPTGEPADLPAPREDRSPGSPADTPAAAPEGRSGVRFVAPATTSPSGPDEPTGADPAGTPADAGAPVDPVVPSPASVAADGDSASAGPRDTSDTVAGSTGAGIPPASDQPVSGDPPAGDAAAASAGSTGTAYGDPGTPAGERSGSSGRRNALRPVLQRGTGRGGQGGSGDGGGDRPPGREGGPAVGPLAILIGAGVVLLVLLGIILINQDDETRQETAAPCILADVPGALAAIADGSVTNIRAAAASNDLSQFAVAVELDIDGGGCLSLPQGPDSVDTRTAVLGAATIYNSQTEGRRINLEIRGIEVPPTATPTAVPTETPAPTVEPTLPVVVPPADATPDAGTPEATPIA